MSCGIFIFWKVKHTFFQCSSGGPLWVRLPGGHQAPVPAPPPGGAAPGGAPRAPAAPPGSPPGPGAEVPPGGEGRG